MRFALLNSELVDAKSGLMAICPGCSQPMVAKCGTRRVHHWAHRGSKPCDDWWEPETEWHRAWKNNFPIEWQEVFLPDEQTGEKHIADVRTPDGIVIEFQHSNIGEKERTSRENFYKEMIWVVDGTRLKKDFSRFVRAEHYFRPGYKSGIFYVAFPEKCFPLEWVKSSVPIIFDFLGKNPAFEECEVRQQLYCLLPLKMGSCFVVAEMSRKAFIDSISMNVWTDRLENLRKELNQVKLQQHEDRRIKKERYNRLTSGRNSETHG